MGYDHLFLHIFYLLIAWENLWEITEDRSNIKH